MALSGYVPFLWWLLAAGAVAGLVLSGAFGSLLRKLTKFSGFGLDFEFDAASARETRASVETGLKAVRRTIVRELEAAERAASISQLLGRVLEDLKVGRGRNTYRATIHIPDPLFENWLYQLVDYYPSGGGSHGRSIDSRGGIVGLAWRTGRTQASREQEEVHAGNPAAASPPAGDANVGSGNTPDELIARWGMTHREAVARSKEKRKSLLAVVLHDANGFRRIGVLYLDSEQADLWGKTEEAMKARGEEIGEALRAVLGNSLTDLVFGALRNSPQLLLEGIA